MGRELKRVPLDFNYPLKKVWKGYSNPYFVECPSCENDESCKTCGGNGIHPDTYERYELWEPYDPPAGKGYQLWETVSEGSPISPVFDSLEVLCEWCEKNASPFANFTATKEEWLSMLSVDFFRIQKGNTTFL